MGQLRAVVPPLAKVSLFGILLRDDPCELKAWIEGARLSLKNALVAWSSTNQPSTRSTGVSLSGYGSDSSHSGGRSGSCDGVSGGGNIDSSGLGASVSASASAVGGGSDHDENAHVDEQNTTAVVIESLLVAALLEPLFAGPGPWEWDITHNSLLVNTAANVDVTHINATTTTDIPTTDAAAAAAAASSPLLPPPSSLPLPASFYGLHLPETVLDL
jgi:hypothetical protein